ncbi:GLUG motif-containing protein, partial [Paenibacillus sp. sgz5001063]|uniref:GLUG motif-containing protein n=1 Tax=Paenibacillus sp. sgz5001063 TaxID=3242474 RepID=UPI0036D40994
MDRVYKKGLSIFLVLLMVLGGISGVIVPSGGTAHASVSFAGGTGTASDPYQIATADQLNEVRNYLGAYYKLTADIDLSSYVNWMPIGGVEGDNDFTYFFYGNIDGNGYKVTNLKINRPEKVWVGLFGANSGNISNMFLENVEVKGSFYVGGLVGENYHGTVTNSYVTGSVMGTVSVGSVVGEGPITAIAAAIAGVTAPVEGATPVAVLSDTAGYTATIAWNPEDATFAAVASYTATIEITPKPGYTITGVPANFFTVAGAITSNAAGSGVVTAVFPATSAVPITTAAIAGVTVPVVGETPVATIADTAEYTAAIAWTPSDTSFAGAASYTATISLTPKPAYTLAGVAKNFFKVAGAITTNAAGSGVVTAVFPATASIPIATAEIAGVTAPVAGAMPITSIADTAEYTAAIAWTPADATFAGAASYTATISLTPKPGFTLAGVAKDFFTVAG